MSGLAWDKFFWSDYASDPGLKLCSLAAQGLWMRMLAIASEHNPRGFVAVNGEGLDDEGIATLVGKPLEQIVELRVELERRGVFSRDRRGWIYSRRMINDAKRRRIASVHGKKGVELKREKQKEKSAALKGNAKGSLEGEGQAQKPEARVQSKKTSKDVQKNLPENWEPEAFGAGTKCAGIVASWSSEERELQIERFKAHHEREKTRSDNWQGYWKTWVLNSEAFANQRRDRLGQRASGDAGGADYLQHYVSKEMAGGPK